MQRVFLRGFALTLSAVLCGCTVIGINEVPISDRSVPDRSVRPHAAGTPAVTAPTPMAREARDGTYVVQRGDTLYSIALALNQDVRDLARWNNVENPNGLRVGQILRVSGNDIAAAAPVVDAPIVVGSSIESRPLDSVPLEPMQPAPSAQPATPMTAPQVVSPWMWPVQGKVVEPFSEGRTKGIDIAGKEGDPVVAAQDGQVVYSGNSLKGFGNLVIIKHSDDFVSAYAHNKVNIAQHGQRVKRGERIAELGRTETDAPKLHFEIRSQGKPVDPLKYLPPR